MTTVQELRYGNTRCYLLDRRVLIDTDWAGTLPKFLQCLSQKNIAVSEISHLLVTHFHPDHMGIAQELAELGIRIVVFDVQRQYIHSADAVFGGDKKVRFAPIDDSKILVIPCARSREFLKSMGIDGEVLSTPGHSGDSISVLLDDGIALVGDLPPLALAPAYCDDTIRQSWDKILARRVHTVYYSHAEKDHPV